MSLAPALVLSLAAHCAPTVDPSTLAAVVRTESANDPWVIGVNSPSPSKVVSANAKAAGDAARRLIAAGANIDLGLAQINSRTLMRLGLTVSDAFDPCRNLAAAGRVLTADYRQGLALGATEQTALRIALSYYNTGRPDRGFQNGYVAKVTGDAPPHAPRAPAPQEPTAPTAWDVFASSPVSSFVITPLFIGDAP